MSARTASVDVARPRVAVLDLDAAQILFLLSAFIAPLNLLVLRAFTAYDLVTGLVFLLLDVPWLIHLARR